MTPAEKQMETCKCCPYLASCNRTECDRVRVIAENGEWKVVSKRVYDRMNLREAKRSWREPRCTKVNF